jgi:hypothetical protein
LRSRSVSHIPLKLSQSSNEVSPITAVLARRILPRKPFIIPPSFFSCIQAEILIACEGDSKQSKLKGCKVMCWEKGLGIWCDDVKESNKINNTVCALIECTPKWIHNNWSQNPESCVDIIVWGEGQCSVESVQNMLTSLIQLIYKASEIVLNGRLLSSEETQNEKSLVENSYSPTIPLVNWLKVIYLRPGCVLHTLAMIPSDRDCGEYIEDADSKEPFDSPILVSCHHPQPRLTKGHLKSGYILSESPGGGKGLLRSINGSLCSLLSAEDSIRTSKGSGTYEHSFINFYIDSTMASE